MVKKISEQEYAQVEASKVALIDFSATWCGPCQMLGPVLEQVSEEMAGKVDFYNVDVDENMGLAQKFGITNIPALVVLKDGKPVDQTVGFQPKESLLAFLNKQL